MGNTTKTYAGRRILTIPNYLYPHIVEQMKIAENDERNEEKLLFKPEYRKYTYRGNVNSELHRILEKEFGITDISTYSLRHTFGTRCLESGMQPVVVQRMMGHTDVSVTLNTYTSVFDQFKNKEIEKVNQYYLEENLISSYNVEHIWYNINGFNHMKGMSEMKSMIEKKDPNLAEKVKAVKEGSIVSKSALETNAKNTKEYYDTLQEIVKANENTSKEYIQLAKAEMEIYKTAMEKSATEEERKQIYEKIESLNEKIKERAEKELNENSDIKEKATMETQDNKEFNWSVLKGFGLCALSALGAIALKEAPNIIKKMIDKKWFKGIFYKEISDEFRCY